MAQTIDVPITLQIVLKDSAHTTGVSAGVKSADQVRADLGRPTEALVNLIKTAAERRYTLGVSYPALKADVGLAADGHRDFTTPEVLEETAWNWMKSYRNIGLHHADGTDGAGEVVESYIYRGPDWIQTSPVDGQQYVIKAGDWLLGTVWDPAGWDLVKQGLINGYSPQGGARRATPTPERLAQLRS